MRLFLIENPQRTAWLDKMLVTAVPDEKRRLVAVNALLEADPTTAKKLSQWLCKLAVNGVVSISGAIGAKPTTQIRLPEDSPRVQDVLATFERSKPRLPQEARDINRLKDFYSLEDMITKVVDSGVTKGSGKTVRNVPGANVVFNDGTYVVYNIKKVSKHNGYNDDGEMEERDPEEMQRIKAVQTLGMGPPETKWCTREGFGNSYAEHYLSRNNMYVVYKDGVPLLQKCGSQIMDVNDRPAELPPVVDQILKKRQEEESAARKAAMKPVLDRVRAEGRKAIVTETAVIPFEVIVDAGSYYYVGTKKLAVPKRSQCRSTKKKQIIESSGLAVYTRAQKYPDGKQLYYGPDRGKFVPDSSTIIFANWRYDTITVNKDNVIEIVGEATRPPAPVKAQAALPQAPPAAAPAPQAPRAAAPAPQAPPAAAPAQGRQSFMRRLSNVFGR